MVAATNTNPAAALLASLNTGSSTTNSTSGSSASSIESQFLTMLTAQLQNQDPTNPMDNAQITSQMAQLSTVEGISQLNTSMQQLNMSQALSATSMIGQGVLVNGSTLTLSSSQALGGVSLSQPASDVVVTIKDSAGNTVTTLDLGAQQTAGTVPFTWNGQTSTGATAADGSYSFSVKAVAAGTDVSATALSYGTVNAVLPSAQGINLSVGQLGQFPLSAVNTIL